MNNKAQGISMEIIIIAVTALIVLAVIAIIFIGKIGIFGDSATKCNEKAKGASCQTDETGCRTGCAPASGLCPKGQVCCIPLTAE